MYSFMLNRLKGTIFTRDMNRKTDSFLTKNIPCRLFLSSLFLILTLGCVNGTNNGTSPVSPRSSLVADHTVIHELWDGNIPEEDIQAVKNTLHIAYGHTSHGSQITDGMTGLVGFADDGNLGTGYTQELFRFSSDGSGGSLHLFEGDGYGDGPLDHDAGYYPDWITETEEFLQDPSHAEYNVIMWSWCGTGFGFKRAADDRTLSDTDE